MTTTELTYVAFQAGQVDPSFSQYVYTDGGGQFRVESILGDREWIVRGLRTGTRLLARVTRVYGHRFRVALYVLEDNGRDGDGVMLDVTAEQCKGFGWVHTLPVIAAELARLVEHWASR